MAFAIVEFINKQEVEVVPSSWIDGSMCSWPFGKPERINKLVRASAETSEDWEQHPVEIKDVFCKLQVQLLLRIIRCLICMLLYSQAANLDHGA